MTISMSIIYRPFLVFFFYLYLRETIASTSKSAPFGSPATYGPHQRNNLTYETRIHLDTTSGRLVTFEALFVDLVDGCKVAHLYAHQIKHTKH